MSELKEYLTVAEVIAQTGMTRPSILRAITVSHTLKAEKKGHQWLIHRDDLNEYIANKPRGGYPFHKPKD